jgi:hypothetical protein
MTLEPDTNSRYSFVCESYLLRDMDGDILQCWHVLKAAHPGHAFLFMLDDYGQSCYTSMHAVDYHDLDDTEGQDLSHLPPDCFEDGEHKGYLSTPAELPFRMAAFYQRLADVTMDDVMAKRISLFGDPEEQFNPIEAGRNLFAIMDEPHRVLKAPLAHGYETVMVFPNGYFSDDLSPFENYVLAKHLEENFGYVLIGMGASKLAYARTRALDEPETRTLMDLLQSIYRDEFAPARQDMLKQAIGDNDILVLRYSE